MARGKFFILYHFYHDHHLDLYDTVFGRIVREGKQKGVRIQEILAYCVKGKAKY
jgi:hypothetical protein